MEGVIVRIALICTTPFDVLLAKDTTFEPGNKSPYLSVPEESLYKTPSVAPPFAPVF